MLQTRSDVASAVTAPQSSAIAQGYRVDNGNGRVSEGALVSFTSDNPRDTVELAMTATASRLVGVADQNPAIAISSDKSQVQVVLNGTTTALVSNINGTIHSGDKIAPSPIAGVGMKATTDGEVVGTTQSDFSISRTASIRDESGKKHSVQLGYVTLRVGTAYYQAPGSNFLPPFIQNLAYSLAGRQVSLLRIILAGLVVLLGFMSAVILVYSGVRSAMQAIGRNPLAAANIRRGLYQILLIAIVLAGGGALASYLLLRA